MFKNAYLELKNKYKYLFNLSSQIGGNKKNAIFNMCIVNEHYVLGCCVIAYCHRKLLEKHSLKNNIDLILICDELIYEKYHSLLKSNLLYDDVVKLEMRYFKDSSNYDYAKYKYSSYDIFSPNI